MSVRVPRPPAPSLWEDEPESEVQQQMREFIGDRPRGERKRTLGKASLARASDEVDAMVKADDFKKAGGKHFVALYAKLHLKVYGAEAEEMGPQDRLAAVSSAGRCLATQFEGDGDLMADFVVWAWQREDGREKWRRETGNGGRRLGWRLLFSSTLVADYRVEAARRAKGG